MKRLLYAALAAVFILMLLPAALADGPYKAEDFIYFTVPADAEVSFRGEKADEAYILRRCSVAPDYAGYMQGQAGELIQHRIPAGGYEEVEVFSRDGKPLIPVWESGNLRVYLPEGTAEAEKQAGTAAEHYFEYYMHFCCSGSESSMFGALQKTAYNSPFYQHIAQAREGMIFASSTTMDYSQLEFTNYFMAGDCCFICAVHYKAQCTAKAWYETYTYPLENTLVLTFIKENGQWRCALAKDITEYIRVPLEDRLDSDAQLQLLDIAQGDMKGKLIAVKDPTKVILGTIEHPGRGDGLTLPGIVELSGGIAGINAGGFNDENGRGSGAIPQGLVISDGSAVFGDAYGQYPIIGIDGSGRLIIATMTGMQALEAGVKWGVSFVTHLGSDSALLRDGQLQYQNFGTGVNPRTAIGQREDGTLLLLVLDGRCPDTIGCTIEDVALLMQELGAVNAGNLDGGSSSTMVFDGKIVNNCSSCTGPRKIPTAFVVLP